MLILLNKKPYNPELWMGAHGYHCRVIRHLILPILLLGLISTACAQRKPAYTTRKKSAIASFEEAQKALRYLNYTEAHAQLSEAIERDPQFVEAWLLRGSLYAEQRKPADAAQSWREALRINPRIRPSTWIDLAQMELKIGDYASALKSLSSFEAQEKGNFPPPLQEKINLFKSRAQFGIQNLEQPVPYEPFNLGKSVNTPYDEYHPSLTVDGRRLIFTSREPIGKNGQGQVVLREDIYLSVRNSEAWQPAKNLGSPVNAPTTNEGSSSISPDGHYLFFTACHTEEAQGSCDIFYAVRKGRGWDTPKPMQAANSGAWESHPVMSADGSTFYFTSNRKGGKGGMDIWMCKRNEDGTWTSPISLPFNTPGDEMTPFIHPDDQTLYFASDYLLGMGGHDMFVVRRNAEGNWETPKNLGYPINTHDDEHGLIVDPRGQLAYYATNRAGGLGGLDIFGFPLYSSARPGEVYYLEGRVRDAQSKKPLEAHFTLKDVELGNAVIQSYSDPDDGSFLVPLPAGRNFALSVQKNGYLFYSDRFFFKGSAAGPQRIEVLLQPITEGATVVLQNIFFETGKFELEPNSRAELGTLVKLLTDNPALKIEIGGHTDNVGKAADNQLLSENRAHSVFDFLVREGIDPQRLSYKGYGPDKPIASNDSEAGRADNRRTEFKVLK
jgi:outer membrane protein OmpA-like peptidoglycan-associated protein